jgi:hypothetical protein
MELVLPAYREETLRLLAKAPCTVRDEALMEELHTDSIDGGHEASYGARSRARKRAYWFMQISCDSLALRFFSPPTPTANYEFPTLEFRDRNLYVLARKLKLNLLQLSDFEKMQN